MATASNSALLLANGCSVKDCFPTVGHSETITAIDIMIKRRRIRKGVLFRIIGSYLHRHIVSGWPTMHEVIRNDCGGMYPRSSQPASACRGPATTLPEFHVKVTDMTI
jgi:hypothetical protein